MINSYISVKKHIHEDFGQTSPCEFCIKLQDPYSLNNQRDWYDFSILIESDDFVAVPALGSIVPGYLLIVTRQHIPSMSKLNETITNKLLKFSRQIAELQSKYWDWPIIFEHGAYNNFNTAGSSINHAHWHMVPGNWNLFTNQFSYIEINSFLEIFKFSNYRSYLFLKSYYDKKYLFQVYNLPSQYFRRKLAMAAGIPKMWNYISYPMLKNIRETITKIKELRIINL